MAEAGADAPVHFTRIDLAGARALSRDLVLKDLGFRGTGDVDTLLIPRGIGTLLERYAHEGYFSARIEVTWKGTDPGRVARVEIAEGDSWRFGTLREVGIPESLEVLSGRLPVIREGDRYRTAAVDAALEARLAAYDEAGFPFARIRPTEARAEDGRVDLTFVHTPGPRVVVRSLELAGARITRPRTVERAMGFAPGAWYRQSTIENGLERLRASGLFVSVADPELVPGLDPAAGRIRLHVKEAPVGSLSGLVGYSGADRRFAGDLDFRLRNISGTGRQLRLQWSSRQKASTLYGFAYREPGVLGLPVDLSIELQHVLFDTLYTRTRSEAALLWRAGSRFTATAGLGRDRAVITSVVRRTEGTTRARGALAWDGRNSPIAPNRGFYADLQLERGETLSGLYGDLAGAPLERIYRAAARGELFRRLSRRAVLALAVSARSLDTPARPIPQYDLFPLGGANTLRGYREEQFYTPGYLLAQWEYRLETGPAGTGAYLFLDSAVLSPADARGTFIPVGGVSKTGYGAGVRVGSRLGRVGIDYGLATGEGPLDGRIHLRIETEF